MAQAHCGGPCPRRHDVSPDPCRPAAVTQSAHRHSLQQTGRGRCCRAGCKIAECERRRRPKRPSPNRIAVRAHVVRAKRPPNFTIPWSGSIAGGRLPTLFVALAVDWFKMRSGESRALASAPLTKWFDAGRSAAGEESLGSSPRPFLSPPDSGRAYRTTAAHPRGELARPLNHSPASATNEWVDLGGSTCICAGIRWG